MMTFEEYKTERDILTKWLSDISKELDAFPKNELGMTIESVRVTDAYQSKRALSKKVFAALRNLNGVYVKVYKKELAAERKARFSK